MTEKQPARDAVLIAALATGATWAQAGTAAGCSARTVGRRLADPTMRAALGAERQRLAEQVADALTGAVTATVTRLAAITEQGADRDAVGAARVLLAEARAWRETAWVTQRLDAVEDELTRRRNRR